jgi:site-specific recombinase XerD
MADSLLDLADMLSSWELAMRAEGKSPATVKTYRESIKVYLRWCGTSGIPAELTRSAVQAFIADLLDNGAQSATATTRQKALKQFSKWLHAEGEIESDPLDGLKQPKQDHKVVSALSDDELKALIKACQGRTLRDRRDEALVRLMAESGLRAAETINLRVSDVDLIHGLAVINRGKGGKGRTVPFGTQTGAAVDRYLRLARREGRLTENGPLWVGAGGKSFGYHGLDRSLRERARLAGIAGFHLHLLRSTAATRWLRAGGSEQGLMSVAGWSTRAMLDRYTGASAAERAADEARRLNLGDM